MVEVTVRHVNGLPWLSTTANICGCAPRPLQVFVGFPKLIKLLREMDKKKGGKSDNSLPSKPGAPHASAGSQALPAINESWLRRNIVAMFALVASIGAIIVPVIREHSRNDFNNDVDRRIDAKLQQPLADISQIKADVQSLRTKVDDLNASLNLMLNDRLKRIASLKPSDINGNLPQISTLLRLARHQRIKTSTQALARLQQALTPIVKTNTANSDAWKTYLELAGYRSMLNSDFESTCCTINTGSLQDDVSLQFARPHATSCKQ